MTISIKPTASGSTIEQDGSTILTVDGSGNLSTTNNLTVGGTISGDGSSLTGVPSLGVGQTWTNVTASRAIATTYTNTTGKPICVVISCTGNGVNGLFGVQVGGSTIMFSPSTASNGHWSSVSFVVPNGSTYATNQQGANVTLGLWWELR